MTRQLLALAGMLLAVLGLAIDSRAVVWVASALLTGSIIWRLLATRQPRKPPPGGEE
jgi:hypothetical protein